MRNMLARAFASLRPSASAPDTSQTDTIRPERPLYAVGDIHGRDDLAERLIGRIEAEITAHGIAEADLVFLGDYIDRGAQSAQVLARLRGLEEQSPDAVTCLLGNHERMMIEFLDDPAGRGARWLGNGGIDTLASFGITGIDAKSRGTPPVEDLLEASDALAAAMPAGMAEWLRNLPLLWQSGNVVCVHAAMNPQRAPKDQDERALIWGHKDFGTRPREDGLWVVHGHTIFREPLLENGRIGVDTGAHATGRLTAAALSGGTCRFL